MSEEKKDGISMSVAIILFFFVFGIAFAGGAVWGYTLDQSEQFFEKAPECSGCDPIQPEPNVTCCTLSQDCEKQNPVSEIVVIVKDARCP
ncbi:hypothetical protein MsAg5_13040 [Methanosarcinaceae archaeon Ag5]|uniref:Uncharacterized protein n=1 Tax=Methanolapillus africanus TaxID=3028297 RepID=A0AAE4SE48_9EURY|nr:hypothetical protein [Methanosarcinaceae archaeon Ag5]